MNSASVQNPSPWARAPAQLESVQEQLPPPALDTANIASQKINDLAANNEALRAAHRAALNMMEDAVAAREALETANRDLHEQIARREQVERLLRLVMDLVPYSIFAKDRQSRYFLSNRAHAEVYGTTVEKLVGRTDRELATVPEQTDVFVRDDQEVISTGKPKFIAEEPLTDSTGHTRLLQVTKVPFIPPGTDQPAVMGVAMDITELKATHEALERASAYNRSLIEADLDPLITIDPDGKTTDVNAAAENATGHSRQELIGTDFSNYFTEPEKGRAAYQQAFREGSVRDVALQLRHRNGRETPVLYNASVYRDPAGTVIGVVAAMRDITAQRQVEDQLHALNAELDRCVIRRTAELEVANRELEAFCYSVSHDLRAPLRAINGFSLALLDDCADKLDDQAKDYLNRVRAATSRMAQLIDDLLKLSRITRAQMRREPVDLNAIAQTVTAELRGIYPQREVDCRIASGLSVHADANLMYVVLQNLLSNAWKFTGRTPQAVIELGTTQQDGMTVYFVRDNGAGFDMAYADRLFGAFQRLHSTTEFEGTGIGLATVQRIINRHGGRIWAEAAVDQGATFYFTLPETDEPKP